MENWGPSVSSGIFDDRLACLFFMIDGGCGLLGRKVHVYIVPMHITVPALCAFTFSPSRTPGWLMASWTALERGTSNGSAMLTWPTRPFSKKVHGRT